MHNLNKIRRGKLYNWNRKVVPPAPDTLGYVIVGYTNRYHFKIGTLLRTSYVVREYIVKNKHFVETLNSIYELAKVRKDKD